MGDTTRTWITVCDTCRIDREAAPTGGAVDGERLAALVEAAAAGRGEVAVRRHSCLMGCANGCNVTVQGAGKLNYSLGGFAPEAEAAAAIVDYAAKHAASDGGRVPFREWPQGVKGHFVSRHPPLPE